MPLTLPFTPLLRTNCIRTITTATTSAPRFTRFLATQTTPRMSSACCSIPPVTTGQYDPKGTYAPYAGFEKAYITGPKDAKVAITGVFDIFGYFPQTLQAADIIASKGYRVILPDFFRGKPYPLNEFPPSNAEQKKKLADFFGGIADISKRLPELIQVAQQARSEGAVKVGSVGWCWGGKVNLLAGSNADVFDAVAAIHPAMLDPADAEKLQVPAGFFPSKDEPEAAVKKVIEILSSNKFKDVNAYHHYTHPKAIHGFSAARGDLSDPEVKELYEDVYKRLTAFFKKALGDA